MELMQKYNLQKIDDYRWEIPPSFRADMRVPARLYATEQMLAGIGRDRSIEQLINVASLTGVVSRVLALPDMHEGYGFPIGGVAATRWPDGGISPGGIGYDINCGVRLLKSSLDFSEVKSSLEKLVSGLYRDVPSGVGQGGPVRLSVAELDKVLRDGVHWAVKRGYGTEADLELVESSGRLGDACPETVSQHAKKRGIDQLGTLGAGNHFVEIDCVEEIFHPAAETFGLHPDQMVVLIHTGSRGLGHQVATDHIRIMMAALPKYGIKIPDRELVHVPFSAPEGRAYFGAMAAAANFAWANRQVITDEVRGVWSQIFGRQRGQLSLLYDVAHNIAKIEEHRINGERQKLILHRKGATRAFGSGHREIPEEYRAVGQPVIIPGSMGTASYVLVGTEMAMRETFGSTCHGAGRAMSRQEAKRRVTIERLRRELGARGVHYQSGSIRGLLEEAPSAYKDVDEVVGTVHGAGLALKVARLRPVAVIKG